MQKEKKTTTELKGLKEDELYIIRGGNNKNKEGNFTSVILDIANRIFRSR